MKRMKLNLTLLVGLALLSVVPATQAVTDIYTVSGTWTAPAGVTSVDVEVWGGGGAGGGNPTNQDGAGGGGGGAYSKTTAIPVVPGTVYTVTVGAGGIGGTGAGGAGGDSWFSTATTILAKGGTGGADPVAGAGGVEGVGGAAAAGIGTTKFSGGNGGTGRNSNTGRGGPGGSSAGTGANGTSGPTPWSAVTQSTAQPPPTGGGIGGDGGNANRADGLAPASGNGGGGGGGAERSTLGGNGAVGKVTITYTPPPTVLSINTAGANPSNAASVSWTVTFSASVAGGSSSNFTLVNSGLGGTPAITSVTGTGTTRTVTASTGSGSGTLGLNMANTTGVTPALAGLPFTTGQTYTIDRAAPTVSSITRVDPTPTALASVSWTVTFNEAVTGVDATDFALAQAGGVSGALITGVTPVSGTVYTVTASTGVGNGTLGLNLVDNDSIVDTANNPLGGTGAGNGNFTGQVYDLVRPVTVTANPTLCVNDPSIGVPTGNWTGLTSVGAQDLAYAIASVANSDITNYLKCTGYNFAIPAGATITGITVGPWLNSTWTMLDNAMQLVKGGVIQPTNLATGVTLTNGGGGLAPAPTQYIYGSSTNLWGNTWTAADINSANFGTAFAAQRGGFATTQQAAVDAMPITIDYTVPPSTAVLSINRVGASPTNAASVSWTVVFDKSVTGVDATAFALAAGGISGAYITSVTGSGTTWTVTANTGIGSGTLGLNQTVPGSVAPPLSGTFTGQVYSISATPALAEYRMDETSWNGTANEAIDSATGSFPGTAAGLVTKPTTANISPAIAGSPGTCNYGVFNRTNKDYIALPGGFPNLAAAAGDFTITAWINVANNTLPGQRIFIDDQNNTSPGGLGFSVGETTAFGAGGLRFYYRQPSVYILDTAPIPSNQWLFVALSVQLAAGANASTATIYAWNTAGTLVTSNTGTFTWTAGSDLGAASIGGETNASGEGTNAFGFGGNIDELRIYQKALNQSALAAIAAQTHACAVAAPHHIRIEHDGSAISCSAEAVVVKACSNADCSILYTGGVSGNLTAGGNSLPFSIASGLSQTTVSIHLPSDSALADPQTVRLGANSVSPVPVDIGSHYCNGDVNNATACDMSVYKAGFLFDVPHLTAGTASGTVNVSAVRSSDSSTCVPLFQNVSRTVAFWSEYQNPATGTLPLQINGSNIETTATPSYTSTYALAFGATGVAALPSVQYNDAGLMQLNARYVGSTANTPPDGGMVVLGSDTFVVKPHHFDLSAIQQTAVPNLANPAAADAAGAKFVKAGEQFSVTVTARNALGNATPNYGKETAAESVKLTSALVGGLGLSNNPAISGTFGGFSNGVATGTAFIWNEVGIITLTPSVGDGDYLGAGDASGMASGNVGRFYPDHLVPTGGTLAHRNDLTCVPASTFTYMGEPMLLTLTLVAQNASNGLTQNYAGSFAKLDGANAGKWTTFAGNDSIGLGAVDGTNALSGRLAINGTPTGSWTTGAGTLTAKVILNRDTSADGAFDNLKLGIAPQDADGVKLLPGALDLDADLNASNERVQVATGKVRYGRVRLNNVHGSELLALSVPLRAEYYDSVSTGFVTNPADSCTGFVIGNVALSNLTGTMTVGATTPSFVGNPVTAGRASIRLSKPSGGRHGSVDVTLTVPAWLQYAWSSGLNPMARATFGVYKGNDEFIYLRESY